MHIKNHESHRVDGGVGHLSAAGPDVFLRYRLSLVSLEGKVPSLVRDFNVSCCNDTGAFPVRGGEERRAFSEEAHLSTEGDSLADPSLSTEDVSELSLVKVTSPMTDHRDERRAFSLHEQVARPELREAELLSEREAALSKVARLREELEVSRAEVAHLQALLREGNVRSPIVVEYLQSDTYRC
ncbi:hypothetical protein ACLOJK_004182 [Asimina triloba]